MDWKVALSSDSHAHYTIGDVDVALQKIDQIAFPESNIVTLNVDDLSSFWLSTESRSPKICQTG